MFQFKAFWLEMPDKSFQHVGPLTRLPLHGFLYTVCNLCQTTESLDCKCGMWVRSKVGTAAADLIMERHRVELDEIIVRGHMDYMILGPPPFKDSPIEGALNLGALTTDHGLETLPVNAIAASFLENRNPNRKIHPISE